MAFLSMALAPMKTLANRFVLDVFVIIERAINGIVLQEYSFVEFVCYWLLRFLSSCVFCHSSNALAGYYFQAPPSASPPQDAWQRCIVSLRDF